MAVSESTPPLDNFPGSQQDGSALSGLAVRPKGHAMSPFWAESGGHLVGAWLLHLPI